MHKKLAASFWIAEENDLSQGAKDWDNLSTNDQHVIKSVLGCFVASDGIVLEDAL